MDTIEWFLQLSHIGKFMIVGGMFIAGAYVVHLSIGGLERIASACARIVEALQTLMLAVTVLVFIMVGLYFASDSQVKGVMATRSTDNTSFSVTVQDSTALK